MGLLSDVLLDPESPPPKSRPASPRLPRVLEVLLDPEETTAKEKEVLPCAVKFNKNYVFWAMQNLPAREATNHFCILGCTGSGKTTVLDLFLQSIAPRFRRRHAQRPEQLILFDAKGEAVPFLESLGLRLNHPNVWLLNPFDQRSAVWDLAQTMNQPAMARHLASLLVPPERQSNAPFYADAARIVLSSVMLALHHAQPGQWTFRDLLCALETKERVMALTKQFPRAQSILQDERHALGVFSTLATKLSPFEEVAALWSSANAPKRFTVSEFLQRPGVLILGHHPVLRESLWPINAVLLKALALAIQAQPESLAPRHWFVLDEFPLMEKAEAVRDLVHLGRSKGVSVTLGLQGLDQMVEIYRDPGANAILEQCTYKSFLRAGGPHTAKWAEDYFGKVRRVEQVRTETWGAAGHSTSVQSKVEDRPFFLAARFLNLPLPRSGGPFEMISDVPCHECFFVTKRPFDDLLAWRKTKPKASLLLRDRGDQRLKPWDEKEEARFLGEFGPPPSGPEEGPDQPDTGGPKVGSGPKDGPPPGLPPLPNHDF